jgi:hypothetical protein
VHLYTDGQGTGPMQQALHAQPWMAAWILIFPTLPLPTRFLFAVWRSHLARARISWSPT